jgi:hypothetical protein
MTLALAARWVPPLPGWLWATVLILAAIAIVIDYFRDRRGDESVPPRTHIDPPPAMDDGPDRGFFPHGRPTAPAGCFWFFIGFCAFILVGLVVAKLLS